MRKKIKAERKENEVEHNLPEYDKLLNKLETRMLKK